MAIIVGVAAHQRWPLRGVPLYAAAINIISGNN